MAARATDGKTCHYYLRDGGCKYGSSCKYGHGIGIQHTHCKYGDACKFGCRGSLRYCHKYGRGTCHKSATMCRFIHPTPTVADHRGGDITSSTDRLGLEIPVPTPTVADHRGGDITTSTDRLGLEIPVQVCITCCASPLEVAYTKCGHMCLCKACHSNENAQAQLALSLCPICRTASGRMIVRPAGVPT